MRAPLLKLAIAGLLVSCAALLPTRAAADVKLEGKWKLVVLAFAEDDFAVATITEADGKLAATVDDAQNFLSNATIKDIAANGDNVTLTLVAGNVDNPFSGKLATKAPNAGKVLGTVAFRGTTYPARLENTDDAKVAAIGQRELGQKLMALRQEKDPQAKLIALQDLLKEYPGPRQYQVYTQILQNASKAEVSAEHVTQSVQTWLADAELYGDAWRSECRLHALKALSGQKPYAAVALGLAQDAVKALADDATTEQRAAVLGSLVSAARLAGKTEIADEAAKKLEAIEAKLDEEYHVKVPPFKPETFGGREKPEHNRVVLLELFTGAQCPPCVAADVAFDGLLKTYQPKELVTLQYHVHIPGPDPLTTPDSVKRMAYYQGRGTPATYFNGTSEGYGGGGMPQSEAKYGQYRQIIDGRLAAERPAKVELKATRSGNKVMITAIADAQAYLKAKAADAKKDSETKDSEKKDGEKAAEPALRLRLALTEEAIRYVGGNQLRFHHHVVRGMPGGAEGKELAAGQGEVELTIDLGDIRSGLSSYLDDFATNQASFPNPLPEIGLKHLSLVAFVQDDADKTVLDAVSVEIPEAK